ncbi:hypothetical protein [Herbaspirillum sp.]|uniref:hypothetical protein n=1 Tax=Herbaspirillum sp. TaxID=1890675 RepID=UPI0025861C1A|nr:hypothetical protein [Herbaspirillum sp.]MCP3946315.1 hypothetical protein [Herbaspirillum sp.]
MAADLEHEDGDTLDVSEFSLSADLFFAVDLTIPADPEGVVFVMGNATLAILLAFDSGNVVLRAGDGATGTPANAAKVSETAIAGTSGVLFGEVDISANSVTLWFWDARLREVTQIGSATAAGSFSAWSQTGIDGAVGEANGAGPTGETMDSFNGSIRYFRAYHSTAAPDMTPDFVLPLYFSRGNVAGRDVAGVPYLIPSLVGASTSPTRLNLSASSPDAAGLGNRALATISFTDHPHTDRVVDPYQAGRTFDPYSRASFWSKWLVRNKHRAGMMVRIYDGYAGQALTAMTERRYFMHAARGPDDNGNVTLEAKDILSRVEERKATAPQTSPGELYEDITASQMTVEVAGAVVADYPASGTIRINKELMTYSGAATSSNGITFTITDRGTDKSTADAHDAEETVQECVRFDDVPVAQVLRTLLATWGGIDEGWLDLDAWETEGDTYLAAYRLTTLITDPVPVAKLVSEVQEQATCHVWGDERAALVKMKAIRGVDSDPLTVSAETHIMPGLKLTEKPRERASQVWIYYDIRDYTGDIDDAGNYNRASIVADLGSETEEQYGEPSIRRIYSRWLNTAALANTTGSKISNRYVDVPRVVTFTLDAKDRLYWVGDILKISHYLDVDQYGVRQEKRWTITSAEEIVSGEVVRYTAEDTTLYGIIYVIMPSGEPDYPGPPISFGAAYIGDSAGLLSDGEQCARIG